MKTITFTLSDKEEARLRAFIEKQDAALLEIQRNAGFRFKGPYHGAIGGAITFHLTSTSLGQVIKVSYLDVTEDITDYASW